MRFQLTDPRRAAPAIRGAARHLDVPLALPVPFVFLTLTLHELNWCGAVGGRNRGVVAIVTAGVTSLSRIEEELLAARLKAFACRFRIPERRGARSSGGASGGAGKRTESA
jgi:hypothetical protein